MTTFQELNFSPYACNVLDYVGRDGLVTANNQPVKIQHLTAGFVITIDYNQFTPMSNLDASYLLNSWQVGVKS